MFFLNKTHKFALSSSHFVKKKNPTALKYYVLFAFHLLFLQALWALLPLFIAIIILIPSLHYHLITPYSLCPFRGD